MKVDDSNNVTLVSSARRTVGCGLIRSLDQDPI